MNVHSADHLITPTSKSRSSDIEKRLNRKPTWIRRHSDIIFSMTSGQFIDIIFVVTDKAILMLTDGDPNDNDTDIYAALRDGNAALGNEVVLLTYGIGGKCA